MQYVVFVCNKVHGPVHKRVVGTIKIICPTKKKKVVITSLKELSRFSAVSTVREWNFLFPRARPCA
jgi:hypothetical protein